MNSQLLKTILLCSLLVVASCQKSDGSFSSIEQISSHTESTSVTSNIEDSSENSSSIDETSSNEESSSSIHEHTYNEPTFTWNEYECSASATCLECSQVIDLSVSISKEVVNASSCLEEGLETYTASVSLNNQTYTDSKDKVLEPLGHNYGEWEAIKESNDYQDGLRKKECSRCHDVIEEIVPTTSPFTFALNNDGESYIVDGFNVDINNYYPATTSRMFNNSYSNGEDTIIIPNSFNNLPVSSVNLEIFLREDEPVPDIYISYTTKIARLVVHGDNSIRSNTNEVFKTFDKKSVIPENINLYYAGDINDWLNNSPINSNTYFAASNISNYNLHLLNKNTEEYYPLEELHLPEELIALSNYAFSHVAIKKIVCNDSLSSIGTSAFLENKALNDIVFNDSIKIIGAMAFYDCDSLNKIDLPASITSIKNNSFNSSSLYEVTIKNGASGYVDAIKNIISLGTIKVIDENGDTSYLDETRIITKNNIDNSDIFNYQGFKVVKINDTYSLACYEGEEEVLSFPGKIVYKGSEITTYTIRKNFLPTGWGTPTGASNISNQDIADAYGSLDELRSNFYRSDNLFFTVRMNNPNIRIEKRAFNENRFISKIYFNGTYEQWCALGNYLFSGSIATTVNVLDENDNYVEMPINQ